MYEQLTAVLPADTPNNIEPDTDATDGSLDTHAARPDNEPDVLSDKYPVTNNDAL